VPDEHRLTRQDDLTAEAGAEREGAARQLLPVLDLPDNLDGL
jgi:hypothetical protein